MYITRARAINEVQAHGCSIVDFLKDCGDRALYHAHTVRTWLGY